MHRGIVHNATDEAQMVEHHSHEFGPKDCLKIDYESSEIVMVDIYPEHENIKSYQKNLLSGREIERGVTRVFLRNPRFDEELPGHLYKEGDILILNHHIKDTNLGCHDIEELGNGCEMDHNFVRAVAGNLYHLKALRSIC